MIEALWIFLLGYGGGNTHPGVWLKQFVSILVRGLWLLLCWAVMWMFKWVQLSQLLTQLIFVLTLLDVCTYVSVLCKYILQR